MKDYSVSVIIPNYNNEKYIAQCIDSILEQSYRPAEIIVVDDCSTDSSRDIIKEYEEKFDIVKGVYLKENKGVSNARNKGLEQVKTPYVTFTDGDDFYFSKDKLKNEMELMEKFDKSSGKDVVVYSPYVLVNEEGQLLNLPKLGKIYFAKGNILKDLLSLQRMRNVPRDYCVSVSLINSVGAYSFEEDFYEDLDLLIRLSLKTKFYPTYKYGVAYRQKSTGLSRRPTDAHIQTTTRIVNHYLEKLGFGFRVKIFVRRKINCLIKILVGILKKSKIL